MIHDIKVTSMEIKYLLEVLDTAVDREILDVSLRNLCLLQFSNKLRYAQLQELKSKKDATDFI